MQSNHLSVPEFVSQEADSAPDGGFGEAEDEIPGTAEAVNGPVLLSLWTCYSCAVG